MRYLVLLIVMCSAAFAGGEKHPFLRFVDDFRKIPGYVYFLVDVSGSVQNERAAPLIQWQLDQCLQFIPDTWQYRIAVFSDSTQVQRQNWIFPEKNEIEETNKWVKSFFDDRMANTELMPALQLAFDEPPGLGVPFIIVVITDACLDKGDDDRVAALLASPDWQAKDKCLLVIAINPGPWDFKKFSEMVASARRQGYEGGAQMLVVRSAE